jgi:hypothetical protein
MNDEAKLDTSGVFEKLFATYRDQFTVFVPAALIIFVPVALLQALAAGTGGFGFAVIGGVLSIIGSFLLQGVVVEAVRDIQDGRRDLSLGDLFRSVSPVLGMLIGAGILAALGIIVGLIFFIVPGLLLLTWWSLTSPVVVIERPGVTAALGRSRAMVRGNGWRVFGVIVVLFIIEAILNAVISALFGGDTFAGTLIAGIISSALVAPLTGIAAAIIYLELRRIKGEAPVPAV